MQHVCPYIARIDHHDQADRYGNEREQVTIWSSVPLQPSAKGYDADRARQVLDTARTHKATHPDADVRVREMMPL